MFTKSLHTKTESTNLINFKGGSFTRCLLTTSQTRRSWPLSHRKVKIAVFYKCRSPGLWAINTAPCCIRTATSSKLALLLRAPLTSPGKCAALRTVLSVPKEQEAVRMPLMWNDCSLAVASGDCTLLMGVLCLHQAIPYTSEASGSISGRECRRQNSFFSFVRLKSLLIDVFLHCFMQRLIQVLH